MALGKVTAKGPLRRIGFCIVRLIEALAPSRLGLLDRRQATGTTAREGAGRKPCVEDTYRDR